MGILDRNDSASLEAWELVRKLATNQELQTSVLRFEQEEAQNKDNKVDWDKFFDNTSVYRLIYKLEIMEAFIEEDENSNLARVELVEKQDGFTTATIKATSAGSAPQTFVVNPDAPPPPGQKKAEQSNAETEAE